MAFNEPGRRAEENRDASRVGGGRRARASDDLRDIDPEGLGDLLEQRRHRRGVGRRVGRDGLAIAAVDLLVEDGSIALGKGVATTAPGSAQDLQLVVPDVRAARAELVERGVEGREEQEFPWGSFAFFSISMGAGARAVGVAIGFVAGVAGFWIGLAATLFSGFFFVTALATFRAAFSLT